MQIVHRVSIASSPEVRSELAALGVVIGTQGLVTFEVDEAGSAWPALKAWIARRKASDFVTTRFERDEIGEAKWLQLVPDWHHGYPQPDEDVFGYREVTYDLSNWCEKCGIGMKQKAPFRMKGEPKWGKNGILQLNWIFDEFFVKPEVWTSVFKPMGVKSGPVLDPKGHELASIVQLVVEEECGIVTKDLAAEKCTKCGRVKYPPINRGFFPALVNVPSGAMIKTKEYFGSGAAAHKRVLISQKLYQSLVTEGTRGVSPKPVARDQ